MLSLREVMGTWAQVPVTVSLGPQEHTPKWIGPLVRWSVGVGGREVVDGVSASSAAGASGASAR